MSTTYNKIKNVNIALAQLIQRAIRKDITFTPQLCYI